MTSNRIKTAIMKSWSRGHKVGAKERTTRGCIVNYILFILKTAYRGVEERAGQTASPGGAKTHL